MVDDGDVFREWIFRVPCPGDERSMSCQDIYIGRDVDILSARTCSLCTVLDTSSPLADECKISVQRGGNAAVE